MPCYTVYQPLGRDEQAPAPLFVRLINPTDLQRVSVKMCELIRQRYGWLDRLNPWSSGYRLLGIECENVTEFLQNYIMIARQLRLQLNENTRADFAAHMAEQFGYRAEDLDVWIEAFLQVKKAGMVPQSIAIPWAYEPTTVGEDVAKTVTRSLPVVALIGLAAVAVYAFSSRGLPRLAARRTGAAF